MRQGSGKVVFAEQLRGMAALLVVLSHIYGVYAFDQPLASALVAAPALALPPLPITPLVAQPWINLGPFGVGIFFLVSGFVIPFSLRRHGRMAFLLARALRIYPTYAAALAVGCLCVLASSRFWGLPMPFGWRIFGANAELLYLFRGAPSIDQVNWTLVIELQFYLFAALARPWILRGSFWPMAAAVTGAAALLAVQHLGWFRHPSFLEVEAMSLPFMLIGTAFHYRFMGRLSARGLWAAAAVLAGVFIALHRASSLTNANPADTASYAWALATFAAAYALRRRLPDLAALRLLARISFPLYAVHVLASFSLMTWLIAGPAGMSYAGASAISLGAMLILAWLLHQGVERWTMGRDAARTATADPSVRCAEALPMPEPGV